MFPYLMTWVAAAAVAACFYLYHLYSTFTRAGVACLPPVPLLGNMAPIIFRKKHLSDQLQLLYNTFPKDRLAGWFELMHPSVVLLKTEVVKNITVKDFDHFVDNHPFVDGDVDPMFGKNIFHMTGEENYAIQMVGPNGQKWHDMRSTLSPMFTSSKMKMMIPFMMDVGNQMVKKLKQKIENSNGYVDVEVADLASRSTSDVIASCAFGLKVDSYSERDSEFYKMGKISSALGFRETMVMLGYASFPEIMKALNIPLMRPAASKFLGNLVSSTMKTRMENKIVRQDLVHLLMEAKKGKLSHEDNTNDEADVGFAAVQESAEGRNTVHTKWSDEEIVSQGVGFLIAGFETVSNSMSWLFHELAINPDIQERLYQEIKEQNAKYEGALDLNIIQEMKYLDMVISEVLRKWPPPVIDRVCTKDYNCGKPNETSEKDYIIRKGQTVTIPIWCFHRDPQYYPDPCKFDPERFSDKNKHKINRFAYIPFGAGPRNCIASRFALVELKLLTIMMLQHLELSVCEKTSRTEELDFSVGILLLKLKGGYWVRFKLRN